MYQRFVGDEFQSVGSVHSTAIPKACEPVLGKVAESENQVVVSGFELVARVVRFRDPPETRSANSRQLAVPAGNDPFSMTHALTFLPRKSNTG